MARLRGHAIREGLPLLNTSGWKTALVLTAPANQRLAVEQWGCSIRGGDAADQHVKLRVVKVSTAGTGGVTNSALSKRTAGGSETLQATVAHAPDGGYSAEPTLVTNSLQEEISTHPQQPFIFPVIERDGLVATGGERLALQYENNGGSAGLTADFHVGWEE